VVDAGDGDRSCRAWAAKRTGRDDVEEEVGSVRAPDSITSETMKEQDAERLFVDPRALVGSGGPL